MGWGVERDGRWISCDAEGHWLQALEHLTTQHLKCGIKAEKSRAAKSMQLRGNVFPPDSAMQFAELCQMTPEGLGLPDADTAWQALQDHAFAGRPYPHEAITAAAEHMDLHGMASASYYQIERHERAFRIYYQQVVERHARGIALKTQAVLGHDSQLSLAERAAIAGQARVQHASANFAGITPAQAIKMMRGGLANA